jgi:hypothetical protein
LGVADELSGAIALIERGYCIGPNAIDAKGVTVRGTDPKAVAWRRYHNSQ